MTGNYLIAALLALIPALINLFLFVYVLAKIHLNKSVSIFLLVLFSLFIWQLNDLLLRVTIDYNTGMIYNETLGQLGCMVTLFTFHFIINFGRFEQVLSIRVALWICYFISIVFTVLILSPLYDNTIIASNFFRWVAANDPGIIQQLNAIWFSLLGVITLIFSYINYYKKTEPDQRAQSRLIFIGLLIPIFVGIFGEYIIPEVTDSAPLALTSLFMTAFSISVLIALNRYKLFDLNQKNIWFSLAKQLKEMIVITDNNQIIKYCNHQFLNRVGLNQEDILNKKLTEFVVRTPDCGINEAKLKLDCKTEITIEINSIPYINEEQEKTGITHVLLDIEKEKNAKEEFINLETKFKLIFENTSQGIIITDHQFEIIHSNLSAKHCVLDSSNNNLLHQLSANHTIDENEIIELVKSKKNKVIEFYTLDNNGNACYVEMHVTKWNLKGYEYFCFFLQNVSDRKAREIFIAEAKNSAEDQERARIARELHDGLGQLLFGINLHINSLIENLPSKKEDVLSKLKYINSLNKQAIEDTRTISHNILPVNFSDLGLKSSIEKIVDTLSQSNNAIQFHLENEYEDGLLKPEIELTLFRIIQEFIYNSIKYSQAKNIHIRFIKQSNSIVLELRDDGIGFDFKKSLISSTSIGLKNIISRSRLINAELKFDSVKNSGTYLELKIK